MKNSFLVFTYHLFGYPNANFYEDADIRDSFGKVLGRPDLIYSTGHIRRRASFNLLGIKGKSFYELSQPVGNGCSGSPIFKINHDNWKVVGIYIADKIEQIVFEGYDKDLKWGIRTIEMPGVLAYGVRMDDLANWCPNGYGFTLDTLD